MLYFCDDAIAGNPILSNTRETTISTNLGCRFIRIHRDGNLLIRKFDQYVGRSVEDGASLTLDALFVKGLESHGEYMSEGKIKP